MGQSQGMVIGVLTVCVHEEMGQSQGMVIGVLTVCVSVQEEMEQSQGMVIAVRAITALLLQAMLVPHAGNPANSQYEIRPRDKPLAFLTTR